MCFNFSEKKKFQTWRRLWFYLAKAQKEIGIRITSAQLDELESNIENIDYEMALSEEKRTRHDVMAHLSTFAKCCPSAASIIHLGATSCFATDNADLIIMRDALDLLIPKILKCISILDSFCEKYKSLPTLGYTHFQPAQLTTVGKRASLWLHDLVSDYKGLIRVRKSLKLRSCKGTVGTQASFLTLFEGDFSKVELLDSLVVKMCNFKKSYPVSGQTYSRKVDVRILMALANLGCSVHKMCTDIRLLSGLHEMSEPFDIEHQVGSSAMPYKRNPIYCERCCGLARHLTCLLNGMMETASVQWLERSLDDSSIRRITIPEAFLSADVILQTVTYVLQGLNVYPLMIEKNINAELPFLAVESILIAMVRHGANRQECHEKLRQLAHHSAEKIKLDGCTNFFIDNVTQDDYFKPIHADLGALLDPHQFIGCAPAQVDSFLRTKVRPILLQNSHLISNSTPELSN